MSRASGSRAWMLLAGVLAAGSLVSIALPHQALDWEPGLALSQPWRWWSAALVHWSPRHLIANLAGLTVVALLGVVVQVRPRSSLAWIVAWPATQLALLVRPDLLHFGGLSGVLHAGVAIVAWHLVHRPARLDRYIGWALMAGTAAKVLLEQPWGPALRHPADWDIAVAPLAHATGAVAGLLCALLIDRRPAGASPSP